MARDRQPITKQSRREGYALHPKAHKIMVKRSAPPGQHGHSGSRRPSQYSTQLREKQKVKRLYGLLERQFRRVMVEAGKSQGKSGEVLLQLLERRLDNVIYRAGFAPSRRGARQLVNHGHFLVNDARVDIPSIRVNPGDVITLRAKAGKNNYFNNQEYFADIEPQSVGWLTANRKKFEVKITGLPSREEAEANINEQLIVEYYSR
jgi:small subunit ribosomal protein S4